MGPRKAYFKSGGSCFISTLGASPSFNKQTECNSLGGKSSYLVDLPLDIARVAFRVFVQAITSGSSLSESAALVKLASRGSAGYFFLKNVSTHP